MVGSSAMRSVPARGSRWVRASVTTSSLASRMRRARATICSPASVSETLLGWRSMSCTPRYCLELLQLRRQRRLADEAALGGAPEVARVGHRDQVAQVLQLDVGQGHALRYMASIEIIKSIDWI